MEVRYVSLDVEATGPNPGTFSMISFGACLVDALENNIYRELKPSNMNYRLESIRVGAQGLECLRPYRKDTRYDPLSDDFLPELALSVLSEKGIEPDAAAMDFWHWWQSLPDGFEYRMAAAPLRFDVKFMDALLDSAFGPDAMFAGHSAEDMNSFYRGLVRNPNAHIRDLRVPDTRRIKHHALEDAFQQAREFQKVLELMRI